MQKHTISVKDSLLKLDSGTKKIAAVIAGLLSLCFVAFVVVIVIRPDFWVNLSNLFKGVNIPTTTSVPSVPADGIYKLGQHAGSGGLDIVADQYAANLEALTDTGSFPVGGDYTLVALHVTVKNNGTAKANFEELSMNVYDSNGNGSGVFTTPARKPALHSQNYLIPLEPGASASGWMTFEVKSAAKLVKFRYLPITNTKIPAVYFGLQ